MIPPDPADTGKVFVGKASYRRRRLVDLAQLLPFLGAFGFSLPLIRAQGGPLGTSPALVVIFVVWFALSLASFLIARRLGPEATRTARPPVALSTPLPAAPAAAPATASPVAPSAAPMDAPTDAPPEAPTDAPADPPGARGTGDRAEEPPA